MSKRTRRRRVNSSGAPLITWALGHPGPPQLNSTVPIRRRRSRDRRRVKASVTSAPPGRDQSEGTRSVAHWIVGAPPHAFHFNLGGAAAEAGPAVSGTATATTASTRRTSQTVPAFVTAIRNQTIWDRPALAAPSRSGLPAF